MIASTAGNKVRLTIFLYFWVSKQMKSNDIQMKNMLGDQEPHSQDNPPTRKKARCTMILEAMQWYDMMP